MKYILTFLTLFCMVSTAFSQENDYLSKVRTLDSTITTLYGVISGEAGEERNWELFKFLFAPDARLIPSGPDQEGVIRTRSVSPDGYIERSGAWLVDNGFFEKEIFRVTETFGSVVHAFSTYESYRSEGDEAPFMRGINSIQLMFDGERWWIVNIYWRNESEDNPIPDRYLPGK